MTLDEIFALIDRTIEDQVTSGPIPEAELREVELRLGKNLPDGYRRLLGRFGSGLYFGHHEILGPHRVFVHDIELVADIFTVRDQLVAAGRIEEGHLPIHSTTDRLHVVDLTAGDGRVLEVGGATAHASFEAFLEAVVLPR